MPRIYPSKHLKLARDIVASGGAIVSEFGFNTPPNKENFPKRNRIISALSLGTLVVEAGMRSGSLITARLALEQGKKVWTIAGTLHNMQARGCHKLIRDGVATLVENTEQIIEDLADDLQLIKQQIPQKITPTIKDSISTHKNTNPILKLLQANNFSAEDLSAHLNLPLNEILAELTSLEIDGTVTNCGGIYNLRN